MRLLFLGTSAATPTRARNVSGLGLLLEERGEWWLFDCGEGTQHQALRGGLSLARLRRIFLSHLHGDHCYGLPGLLASRGLQGAESPLDLYGPPGTRAFITSVQRATGLGIPFPLHILELDAPGVVYEDHELLLRAVCVEHGPRTLAYIFEEKERIGRFRVEEAERLGVPPGPLYGRLKRGETVSLPDGRTVDGTRLVEPPIPGRKIALVFDAADASAILPHAEHAQALVHEATYLERDEAALAADRGHATAAAAGRLAQRAGVEQLLLTHFSPRYESGGEGAPGIPDLVAEAAAQFPSGRVRAARDLLSVPLPRRDKKGEA